MPDIDWSSDKITGSSYPQRVRQAFLDVAMDMLLEQLVDFPARLEHTLDLLQDSV